jgi:hypothetical protein
VLEDTVETDTRCEPDAPRKSNGKSRKQRLRTMDDLDGRTRARRLAGELRDEMIKERGGRDQVDVLRLAMIESCAITSVMLADIQARWLAGEPVEAAEYVALLNARRREREAVGGPEPRDITPRDLRKDILGSRQ